MKPYILFGAGDSGYRALLFLGIENVVYFCDNKQAGKHIDGITVIDYEKLKQIHIDYTVVISTTKAKNVAEISRQLGMDRIPFLYFEEVVERIIEKDAENYNQCCYRESFQYHPENSYFIAADRYDSAGKIDSYFWQDLWAAKHIFEQQPSVHYDIGSRVDGFIAHLASFHQNVCLLDIRPLNTTIPGVKFLQCDATSMDAVEDESIESLSALCSLEHFGLGRYGDPIDPEACFKCFSAICKKIKKGGYVYISVPIGSEHLEFNAHRVFFASTIKKSFVPLELVEFSSAYHDVIEYDIDLHKYDDWSEKGGDRFGLFRFQKV